MKKKKKEDTGNCFGVKLCHESAGAGCAVQEAEAVTRLGVI